VQQLSLLAFYLLRLETMRTNPVQLSFLLLQLNKGVISKETVVLRRWGSETQKFGFITDHRRVMEAIGRVAKPQEVRVAQGDPRFRAQKLPVYIRN